MKLFWRISLMVLVMGGLGAGLSHALPPLTQRLGLAFDGTAEALGRLAREQRRLEVLDHELQIVKQRLEAKKVIVADLMAHQLTLVEAVARFRELSGDALKRPRAAPGTPVDPSLGPIPGQSDEEWLCRKLLDYVRVEEYLSHSPDPVLPGLLAEFEVHLQTTYQTPQPAGASEASDTYLMR